MRQHTSLIVKRFSAVIIALAVSLGPTAAIAASSWNPTLLVNTESFETLDEGDGSTNIELRFGQTLGQKIYYERANSRFRFTNSIYVGGGITATGSLTIKGHMSGASLRLDGDANVRGNIAGSGTLQIGGNAKVRGNLSGASLRIDGNSSFWGTMTASGSISTKQNLTINSDADTNDAVLTFGNNSGNANLTFSNASQLFTTNKGIKATGNIRAVGALSGTSLNVDGGSVKVNNVQYNFTGSQGSANTYLKNDGAGNLTWSTTSVGNGSGNIMSLQPEYPNATYFSSGSSLVGTMTYGYDATNKENYYRWSSSKATLQDYWIAVRVKVPSNFGSWDPVSALKFRYRTSSTSAATNFLTLRLLDTGGSAVALSGNAGLASGSSDTWATANITITGGTFTAGSYVTVLIKAATTTSGYADAGSLDFNWETTNP